MMMRLVIPVAMLFLGGCSLVPFYEATPPEVPPQWTRSDGLAADAAPLQWDAFQSVQLKMLVEKALANNRDLMASEARVEQARAQMVLAGAALYPQVDANGTAQHSRSKVRGLNANKQETLRAGLNISYVVDVWGRVRAASDAAGARLAASEYDFQGAGLSVATETARAYFSYVAAVEQLEVAQQNKVAAEEVLKIVSAQYREGRISELEVAQQKVTLANVEASIAAVSNAVEAYRNALAVLVGASAPGFAVEKEAFAGIVAPEVAAVQPTELIARRPDIRRAEALLRAANFDVGAARAAMLPSLTLSGGSNVTADPTTILTNALATLSAPIFRGGALEAAVDLTEAQKRELAVRYQQVILTAFQEVETALSARAAAVIRVQQFAVAEAEAGRAYSLAKTRYVNGATDFQAVLNAQQSLFNAQNNGLQVKLDVLSATLDVFLALGGNGVVEAKL